MTTQLPMLPSPPAPAGEGTASSCACGRCKGACEHKPGWMMPGQLEKIAAALGLTPKECFDRHFAVDWWDGDPFQPLHGPYEKKWENVFVLAPAIRGQPLGGMYPGEPRGTCVLFQNGLCGIHPVKPAECANMVHDQSHSVAHAFKRKIAVAWSTPENQQQIRDLLGREPQAEEWEGGGFGGGLFGGLLGGF